MKISAGDMRPGDMFVYCHDRRFVDMIVSVEKLTVEDVFVTWYAIYDVLGYFYSNNRYTTIVYGISYEHAAELIVRSGTKST